MAPRQGKGNWVGVSRSYAVERTFKEGSRLLGSCVTGSASVIRVSNTAGAYVHSAASVLLCQLYGSSTEHDGAIGTAQRYL